MLTTASGITQEINFDKMLRAFKKNFCCNGTIVDDPELGKVVQLQGDQRKNIAQFLIDEEICKKEQVKVHGCVERDGFSSYLNYLSLFVAESNMRLINAASKRGQRKLV